MATSTYLVSSALTGLLLIGIVAYLVWGRDWRGYAVPTGGSAETVDGLARSPAVWSLAFLALAFALGLGAVLFVGGASAVGVSPATVGVAIALLSALIFVLFLFFGVYRSARYRGLKSAQAAGVGTWLVGLLLIAAITVKLLTA